MIAVTHQGADVTHIDARNHEIAVPPDDVERVEGIGDGGNGCAALDPNLPTLAIALLLMKKIIELRHIEHRRIEERVRSNEALLGQAVAALRRLDQESGEWLARFDAPECAARQQDVIPRGEAQMSEIAEKLARAGVDEQDLIAVRIAHQVVHAPGGALPEAQAHGCICDNFGGLPRRRG
jgi:hypothetical protein